jgi:hypothetical protein
MRIRWSPLGEGQHLYVGQTGRIRSEYGVDIVIESDQGSNQAKIGALIEEKSHTGW